MDDRLLTYKEYKQQLSEKQKQEALKKARAKTERSQMMVTGVGLAGYGLGAALQPIANKRLERLYLDTGKKHIDHTVKMLELNEQIHELLTKEKELSKKPPEQLTSEEKNFLQDVNSKINHLSTKKINLDSKYSEAFANQAKTEGLKVQILSNLPSILKGTGKVIATLGGAEYLANKLSQKADKTGQGIYDDDYLEGKKKKYLLGAGAALMGLGALGRFGIARKAANMAFERIPPTEAIEKVRNGDVSSLFKDDFKTRVNELGDAIDDLRHVKSTKEYAEAKKQAGQNLKDLKQMGVEAGFNNKTLSQFGFSEGLMGAGAYLFGKGLSQLRGKDPYSEEVKSQYKKYKKEYKMGQMGLKKQSSDARKYLMLKKEAAIETAIALHALQNLVGAGLTRSEHLNKKILAPFAVKAMSEGYHGKAYQGRLGSLITGPFNQVMPEMKGIQREMRHIGKTLREEGVDIHNLSESDTKALDALARGDLKEALTHAGDSKLTKTLIKSFLPINDSLIIAGSYEGVHKIDPKTFEEIEKIYKQTHAHRTLKNIADYIKENSHKAFAEPKGVTLKENELLNNTIANNIAHVGLAIHDPITASFNAVKRLLVADKFKAPKIDKKFNSETLNGIVNTLNRTSEATTKGVNTTKKAVELLFNKIPSGLAYSKGLVGSQDISKGKQLLNFAVINPVNEAIRSDSYNFGRMTKTMYEAAGKNDPEALEKLKKKQEQARAIIDKLNAKGALDGTKKLLKATWDALRNKEESKFNRDDLLNGLRLFSRNPEKASQAEAYFDRKAQQAIVKNQDKIKDKMEKHMQTVVDQQQRINDAVANIENKINRWKAPGAATGLAVASIPAIKAIHDRNTQQQEGNNKRRI